MKIGIDIIKIARFENKSEMFNNRMFTENERTYIASKANQAQTAAGIFAAKEALAKAIGSGLTWDLLAAEVTHDEHGAPYFINLSDDINAILSISHDDDTAVAVVLVSSKNTM